MIRFDCFYANQFSFLIQGTNPLDKIKQGHYLKIRVIGFRDAKQPK